MADMKDQQRHPQSQSSSVRKAVKVFKLSTEDLETPATVFAFKHDLDTDDVVVNVFDRLGRPLKNIEVTVQNGDLVVVKNSYDWNNGDKIVVIG
jgi:hypothetical protein